MKRMILLTLSLAAVPTGGVAAQSIFNAAGLGLPVDAVNARARALGNLGIGLMGADVSPTDPSAAAGLVVPTAVFTAQPSWVDYERADVESSNFRATRFPVAGIAYPAWSLGTATLTFGTVFDQRYEATRAVTLQLEGGPVEATDEFTSDGGISELRLGLARRITPVVSAGLSVGRYNGSSNRRLQRSLEGVDAEGSVEPYVATGRWAFSGTSVTGGASVLLGSFGRVAGSVTWSSDLTADQDTAAAPDRTFDLPLQLRVGATALLAPGLAVVGSFSAADWSSANGGLSAPAGRDTQAYGVGVELARSTLFGRRAPIRIGYRSADLPFALAEGVAEESAWSFGLGLGLSENQAVTLAGVDLTLERGERRGGSVLERFLRASLTLRVAGF